MRHLIVGTAGHIDHGKSALVQALTGTDPDRLKEEKARGITIDLGFAHWTTGDVTVSFVDVPGHERFVRNMLAGIGGIDAVVLVVASDESVMPQTREHFEICRLLHVPDGLVVLTKADLVDGEMLDLVRMEIRELVAGSFLARAPIVAASAKTGAGLDEVRRELVGLAGRVPPRRAVGVTRLPIDRVFTVKGFGTVATGTLVSGVIAADQELSLLPPARLVKIRGVQVHGVMEAVAVAGQRAAVNLGGVELEDVHRGHSLVSPGTLVATRTLDARLELLPSARALKHGARVRFHQGTSEVLGRVALAALLPREGQGDSSDAVPVAAEVPPGDGAYARLRLEAPAVLSRGDRFILRAYSPPETVGGGTVLDPLPDRGPIRTEPGRQRFVRLDPGTAANADAAVDRALAALVAARGAAGLPIAALVSRLGIDPADVAEVAERQAGAGTAARVGDTLAPPGVLEALGRDVMRLLGDHHRANPLLEGMPREEVRERLFARAGDGVFEQVIGSLAAMGKLAGRDRLALAAHRVSLSPEEERARHSIEEAFRAAGLKPPEAEAVASEQGIDAATLDRVVKLLLRRRVLVRLQTLLFHEASLARLRDEMAALKASASGARIDVAAFKERYGVTRKYAIPLLEYLDRERITRRVGEARVLI